MKSGSIEKGIAEAFDYWLGQHPITTPECLESGIQKAFAAWLNVHEDEIIERIAEKAKVQL